MASSSKPFSDEYIEDQQKKHKRETWCTIFVVLGIIMVVSLSMGITWLVVRPKRPVVAIERGYMKKAQLNDTVLLAYLEFGIRFYNPNNKATVSYDSMEFYNHFSTGITNVGNNIKPFYQPALNVTRANCTFWITYRTMFGGMTSYINNGQLAVKISMKGKISFEEGNWKSMPQTVRIYCQIRKVRFGLSYETTTCNVDL